MVTTSGQSPWVRPLSTGAAARVLGCDRTTIIRAIHRGELPARRLGPAGSYRIAPDALDDWARPTARQENE